MKIMNVNNLPVGEAVAQEPNIDELVQMATRELEQRNNDLIIQVYRKEQEIEELNRIIKEQENNFNKVIGRLMISIFGDK